MRTNATKSGAETRPGEGAVNGQRARGGLPAEGRVATPRRPFSLLHREGPWKHALLRRMLATGDAFAVIVAGISAGNFTGEIATTIWTAGTVPLWILVAKVQGLYDNDHARIKHLTTDELPGLFYWATLSTTLTALVLTFGPVAPTAASAISTWLVALTLAIALRVAARGLWRRLVPPERGLVIGGGPLAEAVERKLALEPGHHLALVASIPFATNGDSDAGREATLDDLEGTIGRERIERVVLAVHDLDERTLSTVVGTCRAYGVKLSVAPPLRAMLGTAVRLNHLAELPLIEFKTWDPSRSTIFLKRSVDIVVSAVGLVLLMPVFVLIAILIRLDSPGPAFFVQQRAGQRGVPFRLVKFRTMVRDAEDRLPEVIRIDELEEPMFKLVQDPRVTRVGRFLRRWSIDELPQLLNVLRGQMSLVGPRPEEVRLVERYSADLLFRLEMRPGITGPMQVHGRGELNFQERVAVEREYVENHSLRKDIQLLLKTVPAVLRRRGAY